MWMSPEDLCSEIEALGLSDYRFARLIGVGTQTVQRWKYGKTPVPRYVKNFLDMVANLAPEDRAEVVRRVCRGLLLRIPK